MKDSCIGVVGLTGQSAFFTADRLPRPGETIRCRTLLYEPGGKGHNQAVACARMGVRSVFVGAVGDDANGRACRAALAAQGVEAYLAVKRAPTAFAAISTARDGENTAQVYAGAAALLCEKDILAGAGRRALEACCVLLTQNELPLGCVEAVLTLAERTGAKVILNPAPAEKMDGALLSRCWLITPNEEESRRVAGLRPDARLTDGALWDALRRSGARRAVVTLGAKGALLADEDGCRRIPAYAAGDAVDTTGAGDAFTGVLAAAVARGKPLAEAARFAAVAAGLSVTRRGAVAGIPSLEEVRTHLERMNLI